MKVKKSGKKPLHVKVVNESLQVGVADRPVLLSLFEAKEVPSHGSTMGPLGGLDLTGYSEYRLTLHFAGTAGTPFQIRELFGPAGVVDQVVFDVDSGRIGPKGTLNYRGAFAIFGPRNFFLQIDNTGDEPFQVDGTLYAVR